VTSPGSGAGRSPAEAEWVAVALLGKPRGLIGELFAFSQGGGFERFESLRRVFLFRSAQPGRAPLLNEAFEIEDVWQYRGRLIVKFQGVDDIAAAERLAGAEVRVPLAERVELEPGAFFLSDLIGCTVIDARSGESLGRVEDFQDAGSGLLVVEGGWLLPFARSFCKEIDIAAKRIVVDLPEGLKDINRK
jgi:16S rRNA processing protein RimM